ncbi:hypothetical protein L873DRAFT_1682833 [Choiromyces venosus 120613-1]|uniref:Orc1-like AAA ATPase domain-containing protein n=1 Tax=Choiromyces venosus 120613-1 TaxID=1336337 RepID=A0A3N4JN50_9PEZI|nr:hypothetical protein L873DRAFT_1682833 [Choiromyces venosus 120613-1]
MAAIIPRSFQRSCGSLIFSAKRSQHGLLLPCIWQQKCWNTNRGSSVGGGNDYQFGPSSDLKPQPSTQKWGYVEDMAGPGGDQVGGGIRGSGMYHGSPKDEGGNGGGTGSGGKKPPPGEDKKHKLKGTAWKIFESAATTGASLAILGLAGYAYHKYYKRLVLQKIDNAFNQGDPALNMATAGDGGSEEPWVMLEAQDRVDGIVNGEEQGHYYLLIGEKGTGKTSMLLAAMHKIEGEACSMMDAHADPEIFRIRLGKALDFEFHEDYIGSLFSIRGPRDTTALLDIERALNKLEKVALVRRKATGKPLIMIINSMHLLRTDGDGKDLLELLQQKAESWAASGLVTMMFNSDDYWVYERLKQYGSRMELISVRDLSKEKAITALKNYRAKYKHEMASTDVLERVYELVGGRLAFLNIVAREQDMIAKCKEICETEKTWLLSKCGLLGSNMDDDVMDQQKVASSAMVLVKYLVDMEQEQAGECGHYNPEIGHELPEVPLYRARQIMTRAEFIEEFDHINIFTIDSKARVRADSVPMQNAFREVCSEPGFAQYLEETLERISDIESLGRTRELVIKDLWYGGKYNMTVKNHKGNVEKSVQFDVTRADREKMKGEEGESDS